MKMKKKIKSILLVILFVLCIGLMFAGCKKIEYIEKEVVKEVPVETKKENKFDKLIDGETVIIRNSEENYDFLKIVDSENHVYFYEDEQEEVITKRPKIKVGDNKFIVTSDDCSKIINIHRNEFIKVYSNLLDSQVALSFYDYNGYSDYYEENQLIEPEKHLIYRNRCEEYIKISCDAFILTKENNHIIFNVKEIKDSSFYVDIGDGKWSGGEYNNIQKFNVFKINKYESSFSISSDVYNGSGNSKIIFLSIYKPTKNNNYAQAFLTQGNEYIFILDYDYRAEPYYKFADEGVRLEDFIGKTLLTVYY